jgi:4-amino-4-deoxy-L-arabinose transferase-like glycosyltransferase
MFHQPPLFPAILNWSHDIFAAGKPYRLLAVPGDKVETIPWRDRLGGQFYACVLPWLSGLLLVVASFWLGREGESGRVGLLAAGALAFSPTFLMSASHVWSDTLLALWVTVGLVAVMRGCRQGNVWWCTAGGLALGLALLTKNVALLSLAVLGGIVWWMRAKGGTGKCVGVSLAFAVLVSAGWFVTIWRVMGSPLFAPTVVGVSQSQDWFRLLNAQPWYAYFVSVPYQMPVLLLGYGAMFRTKWNGLSVVLTVWACVYLVGLTWLSVWDEMIGPEPRYMLPAYPALAVLAATMMERLAKKVGWWAVGLVGAGAVMWSVSLFVKSRQWGVIWDPL